MIGNYYYRRYYNFIFLHFLLDQKTKQKSQVRPRKLLRSTRFRSCMLEALLRTSASSLAISADERFSDFVGISRSLGDSEGIVTKWLESSELKLVESFVSSSVPTERRDVSRTFVTCFSIQFA